MICPTCTATGVRSKSFPDGAVHYDTALEPESYFDEDGQGHVHDPNVIVSPLRCEHGHRYEALTRVPCQFCSYGHTPIEYRVVQSA